ncbi:hypothetical protein AC579_430 [Pseudocercospora musae]|uniref:Secreted protein n=1 Tax=Pseudocercospora musae TaxID=113226 RepID=A0A139GT53_9PEZI|nr:hypothetical protein AC579_430 [Pseudocercospora musae]
MFRLAMGMISSLTCVERVVVAVQVEADELESNAKTSWIETLTSPSVLASASNLQPTTGARRSKQTLAISPADAERIAAFVLVRSAHAAASPLTATTLAHLQRPPKRDQWQQTFDLIWYCL